jgi:hypothetical protein
MKPLTIFTAYKRARQAMEDAASTRKKRHWRIAADGDFWALEWQRRKRQAVKFEARLVRLLEGLEWL